MHFASEDCSTWNGFPRELAGYLHLPSFVNPFGEQFKVPRGTPDLPPICQTRILRAPRESLKLGPQNLVPREIASLNNRNESCWWNIPVLVFHVERSWTFKFAQKMFHVEHCTPNLRDLLAFHVKQVAS